MRPKGLSHFFFFLVREKQCSKSRATTLFFLEWLKETQKMARSPPFPTCEAVLDLLPATWGSPLSYSTTTTVAKGQPLCSSILVPGAAATDKRLPPPTPAQGSAFESSARRELRAWV